MEAMSSGLPMSVRGSAFERAFLQSSVNEWQLGSVGGWSVMIWVSFGQSFLMAWIFWVISGVWVMMAVVSESFRMWAMSSSESVG